MAPSGLEKVWLARTGQVLVVWLMLEFLKEALKRFEDYLQTVPTSIWDPTGCCLLFSTIEHLYDVTVGDSFITSEQVCWIILMIPHVPSLITQEMLVKIWSSIWNLLRIRWDKIDWNWILARWKCCLAEKFSAGSDVTSLWRKPAPEKENLCLNSAGTPTAVLTRIETYCNDNLCSYPYLPRLQQYTLQKPALKTTWQLQLIRNSRTSLMASVYCQDMLVCYCKPSLVSKNYTVFKV